MLAVPVVPAMVAEAVPGKQSVLACRTAPSMRGACGGVGEAVALLVLLEDVEAGRCTLTLSTYLFSMARSLPMERMPL